MKNKNKTLHLLIRGLFVTGVLVSQPAFAICDGCVVAAVQASSMAIVSAITSMNTSISKLLYDMGSAVNQNGEKIASTIEVAAKSQREFSTEQEKIRQVEQARQRYNLPSNICSESASGGASQIGAWSHSEKGNMRANVGKINNPAINQAINTPSQPQEQDAARSSTIHAQYCDADDYAAYGGSKSCPSVSKSFPGADKRLDSLLIGAGPNGKGADLTFSPEQTDLARMYTQNATRRSVGPQLKKGQADSVAGAQYLGLMNQYNAVISAASDPQDQLIADSQPNPITRELLQEALLSPSASVYFKQTASKQATSSGLMSTREFESFEVGRRYANTAYQSDIQGMNGDNLTRELIRVTALNSWILHNLRNDIRKGNINQGLLLASQARQEYEPMLGQKYRAVAGRSGGGK